MVKKITWLQNIACISFIMLCYDQIEKKKTPADFKEFIGFINIAEENETMYFWFYPWIQLFN